MAACAASLADAPHCGTAALRDSYGRRIRDLRISITDRCNYRCVYCRSGTEGAAYSELGFDAYLRLASILLSLGIEKVRITGGEPLLRQGLVEFISRLARLRTAAGQKPDLALTTNGHLLEKLAVPLRDAGLGRITVSMDAVDEEKFERITRVHGSQKNVLAGIRAAMDAGLGPVKVNCVLLRGWNEDQVLPFAEFARREGVIVRFIEYMPLGEGRPWSPEMVVSRQEVERRLEDRYGLRHLPPQDLAETARRYTFADGVGEIGIIAPVSNPFCGACSRLRITADGQLRTCLFSRSETDLAAPLRSGASDEYLSARVQKAVTFKEERHSIGEEGFLPPSRTMVHIGG